MKRISFMLMLILVLTGCSKDTDEVIETETFSEQKADTFIINEQNFEVIPFFNEYTSFTNGEYLDEDERIKSFSDIVVKPLSEEIYGNSYGLYNDPQLSTPANLQKLQDSLIELSGDYTAIKSIIESGLSDAVSMLKGEDYKLYIVPFNPDYIYGSQATEGVSGFAAGETGSIVLFIDPFNYTEESLKATVVHEYHHSVLLASGFFQENKQTLLDWILIEGKAEAFAKTLYPQYESYWLEPLSPDTGAKVWSFIEEKSKKLFRDEDLETLYIGSTEKGFPELSNYRIGYQIMTKLLDNFPELGVEEWTYMDSKEIVKKSKAESLFEGR